MPRHRRLEPVPQGTLRCILLGLLAALAGCGDNKAAGPDAALVAPADAQVIDAPLAPIVDASRLDAAIAPDAVPGTSCAAAILLQPGDSHLGDTSSHFNTGARSCSVGTSSSADALYRVDLPAEPTDIVVSVRVDEDTAQPFDAVLAVETDCGVAMSEVACSDFGFSESLEALALTGSAFIHVDGTAQYGGSPVGAYQIDVRTRSIVALDEVCDPALQNSRCEAGLRCVAGQCQSDSKSLSCSEAATAPLGIDIDDRTHAFMADHFQGSCAFDPASGAPDALYALTLAQPANLRISTDLAATDFDTVVYLLSACEGIELACHDDVDASAGNFKSELNISALPAGDYLIVIDGASPQAPSGRYGLRVDVTPL